MSVLLRQPDGFQGVRVVPISPHPHDPAAVHRPHGGNALVHDEATLSASAADPEEGDHVIAGIDYLLDVGFNLLERLEPPRDGVSDVLEATSGAPVAPKSRNVLPFDVRVVQLAERLPVALPLCFEHGPDNLHVLLRHRPRSIPQAQEPA